MCVVVAFVLCGWLVISSFHAVGLVYLSSYVLSVQYIQCAKQGQVCATSRHVCHLRRRRHGRLPGWRLCSVWRTVSSSRLAISHSRSIADAPLQDTNLERAQRSASNVLAMSHTSILQCNISLPVPITTQAVQWDRPDSFQATAHPSAQRRQRLRLGCTPSRDSLLLAWLCRY